MLQPAILCILHTSSNSQGLAWGPKERALLILKAVAPRYRLFHDTRFEEEWILLHWKFDRHTFLDVVVRVRFVTLCLRGSAVLLFERSKMTDMPTCRYAATTARRYPMPLLADEQSSPATIPSRSSAAMHVMVAQKPTGKAPHENIPV